MTKEQAVYEGILNGELEIDAEGFIWRIASRCGAGKGKSVLIQVPRKRAEYPHRHGYLFVARMVNGIKHQVLAHRLVWVHVHGLIPDGLTINHKNGVKTCNRPDNLELATHGEQALHALHVIKTRLPTAGERSWTAKFTVQEVEQIRGRVAAGESQKSLAAEFEVDASTISNMITGATWGLPEVFIPTRKTKLTQGQISSIRERLSMGAKGRALAQEFGVSPACISRLRHGKTWNSIES